MGKEKATYLNTETARTDVEERAFVDDADRDTVESK